MMPAWRGKGKKNAENEQEKKTPCEHRTAMTWAQRLKRVFNIDVETCSQCGGAMKVIACIEEQSVIDKILAHLDRKVKVSTANHRLPESRAPPSGLFD